MSDRRYSVQDIILAELHHELHETPWWTLAGLRKRRKLHKQIRNHR